MALLIQMVIAYNTRQETLGPAVRESVLIFKCVLPV